MAGMLIQRRGDSRLGIVPDQSRQSCRAKTKGELNGAKLVDHWVKNGAGQHSQCLPTSGLLGQVRQLRALPCFPAADELLIGKVTAAGRG